MSCVEDRAEGKIIHVDGISILKQCVEFDWGINYNFVEMAIIEIASYVPNVTESVSNSTQNIIENLSSQNENKKLPVLAFVYLALR
jgi:hypothetical protein